MELALAANSAARPFASKRPRGARHASHLWGLGGLTISLRLRVRELVGRPSRAADTAQNTWAGSVPPRPRRPPLPLPLPLPRRAATDICGRPQVTARRRSSGGSSALDGASTGTILMWCAAACASRGRPPPARRARRGAGVPPPRRPAELGTRVLVAWRAPHPRVLAHAPRVLWHSMTPRVLHLPQRGVTALIYASAYGHEGCVRLLLAAEAIEVNATVSLEHALPQHRRWIRFHVVIPFGLSFVFRTTTIGQHCISRQSAAASRSPSAFSKGAPIRRFETGPARRHSTVHGSVARARSWRSSASLGTPRACTPIAQRCRADVQRRRLGRTRTTGFRPLGERMAANRHGMKPRGRSAPPMGPHGESRSHILKILGRSPHGPLPRAVVGTSGVGGGLAAWFATRRG
jgi:hypothetical protein